MAHLLEPFSDPNFNMGNGVLGFGDHTRRLVLHLCDLENGSYKLLKPDDHWDEECEYLQGPYHFQGHGSYALGFSFTWDCVGVLWFDVEKRKWELIAELPEDVGRCHASCYCSDGVENIWLLLSTIPEPVNSVTLRFNVASGTWGRFPNILDCFSEVYEPIECNPGLYDLLN